MTELCTNSIRILDVVYGTSVDGPGLRASVYGAGCTHHCPGCHNPQSWDPDGGTSMSIDQLAEDILREEMNVTFSGGDPMFQPEAFAMLARKLRQQAALTIWCYTGYRFEALVNDPRRRPLLEQVDVLVDGPFVQPLRDISLRFRGSSNQRLIDVRASLDTGEVQLYAIPEITTGGISASRHKILSDMDSLSQKEIPNFSFSE